MTEFYVKCLNCGHSFYTFENKCKCINCKVNLLIGLEITEVKGE